MHMHTKKEVVIRFTSFARRNSLKEKYYAVRSLKLKDVIDDHDGLILTEEFFLSDCLTLMASKLSYLCRKLKREERIIGDKFRNGDSLHAMVKKKRKIMDSELY